MTHFSSRGISPPGGRNPWDSTRTMQNPAAWRRGRRSATCKGGVLHNALPVGRGSLHVPTAECHTGIHRGHAGHVAVHHFPLRGRTGAYREGGARVIRALSRDDNRDGPCPARPAIRHSPALLILHVPPGPTQPEANDNRL